jgi:non-specific serine/threonine protein kinase
LSASADRDRSTYFNPSIWRIRLLGELKAEREDRVLTSFSPKIASLLAYLAYFLHRPHPRERLIDLFWPDADLDAGRHSLRQGLSEIRRYLQLPDASVPALLADRQTVRLNPLAVTTDIAEFEGALQFAATARSARDRIEGLTRAVECYRGDLLPGFYDDWIVLEGERLAGRYLSALGELIRELEDTGESEKALEYAQLALKADPLREETHQALIRLYVAMGQPSAARKRYGELERIFREELGRDPSPSSKGLLDRLTRVEEEIPGRKTPSDRGEGNRVEPDLAARDPFFSRPFPRKFPQPLTPLIGRERETEEVKELVGASRLVTLIGAGGVGKTRLAIEVAHALEEAFPGGRAFADLAPLTDPDQVVRAVASAFGIEEDSRGFLHPALIRSLGDQKALLVLDNCEHLLDACAEGVEMWLQGCPNLHVLATSREALNLIGEQRYRVPGLSLPDAEASDDLAAFARCGAVRLFAERARAVQPSFTINAANAPSLLQICRQLDGMPLAIELAATRVCAMPIDQIAGRLDDLFRLLTGGSRTALPRQQTLRALIEWSYQLLSDSEKTLLGRLSVFSGGWTLEAAETICTDEAIAEVEVLDLLTGLVDKSLVVFDGERLSARYRLLETLRQYARERLSEADEDATVRKRHAAFFLKMAEQFDLSHRAGAREEGGFEAITLEYDNLRSALAYYLDETEGDSGLRLACALRPFWETRGHWNEGRQYLERLLARGEPEEKTLIRAMALNAVGHLASLQGDFSAAQLYLEQSLAMAREVGNPAVEADALRDLGRRALHQDDFPVARSFYEQALEISRRCGDRAEEAARLRDLGYAAVSQYDFPSAERNLNQSLSLARELGDFRGEAESLYIIGRMFFYRGSYPAAYPPLEKSLEISRASGDRKAEGNVLRLLGQVALWQRDLASARRYLQESLEVCVALGHRDGEAWTLGDLGRVALLQGDHAASQTYMDHALKIVRAIGDQWQEVLLLQIAGELASHEYDDSLARSYYEQALRTARSIGHRAWEGRNLLTLSRIARNQRDYASARHYLKQALEIHRADRNPSGEVIVLLEGVRVEKAEGDAAATYQLHRQVLEILRDKGNDRNTARCLEEVAFYFSIQGRAEDSCRLLAAAEGIRESLGAPLQPDEKEELDGSVARLRAVLGEERFNSAWIEGRTMTPQQAVRYALDEP